MNSPGHANLVTHGLPGPYERTQTTICGLNVNTAGCDQHRAAGIRCLWGLAWTRAHDLGASDPDLPAPCPECEANR